MKRTILLPVAALLATAILLYALSMGLSGVWKENRQNEHVNMLETVLPGSTVFTKEAYSGDDENILSVHKGETGFVVETQVYGYAGDITMLVGVTNEGTVTGLVVRSLEETHTLGRNALTDHEFLAQYLNTSGEAETGVTVDALTGATVTSRAITRSVNSAVAYVTGADVSSGATEWGG